MFNRKYCLSQNKYVDNVRIKTVTKNYAYQCQRGYKLNNWLQKDGVAVCNTTLLGGAERQAVLPETPVSIT